MRVNTIILRAVIAGVAILTVGACVGVNTESSASGEISFPYDYRDWRHIKTELWGEGHPLHEDVGGLHHIYANKLAVAGYESGTFSDGSILAFDQLGFDVSGGATTEGARKALFVMVRDQQQYPETGGWGFEGFKINGDIMGIAKTNAKTACFACHTSSEDTQFVVSKYRD